MKFLVRSIKYLAYFVLIFLLIVGIVFLFSTQKDQGLSFTDMFQEGSLPKLIIFFLIFAVVYPLIGFRKLKIYLNGPFSKYEKLVKTALGNMGYAVEDEGAGCLTFRLKKASQRLSRLYEDRITFTACEDGVMIEGYNKDLVRIKSNVEYLIRQQEEPQE